MTTPPISSAGAIPTNLESSSINTRALRFGRQARLLVPSKAFRDLSFVKLSVRLTCSIGAFRRGA